MRILPRMDRYWFRAAVVASAVWLAGVTIYSSIARDFGWTAWRSDFGPATVTAIVGVLAIFIVCLGIPWVKRAKQ